MGHNYVELVQECRGLVQCMYHFWFKFLISLEWYKYFMSLTIVFHLSLYHIIPTVNKPCERRLLKTLWAKEKMLVTSICLLPAFAYFSSNYVFFCPIHDKLLPTLSYIYFVVKFQFGKFCCLVKS